MTTTSNSRSRRKKKNSFRYLWIVLAAAVMFAAAAFLLVRLFLPGEEPAEESTDTQTSEEATLPSETESSAAESTAPSEEPSVTEESSEEETLPDRAAEQCLQALLAQAADSIGSQKEMFSSAYLEQLAELLQFEPSEGQIAEYSAEKLEQLGQSFSEEYLDSLGAEQLIVVACEGTESAMYFFEKTDGIWQAAPFAALQTEEGLTAEAVHGYIGRNGAGRADEYHAITPVGVYALGPCFGKAEEDSVKMPYFRILEAHHWNGDPESPYYNHLVVVNDEGEWKLSPCDTFEPAAVVGSDGIDWHGEEHLIDYFPNYEFCVMIQYNYNEPVKYMGSCFFLHVKNEPTGGCVATDRDTMEAVMHWLDAAKNPQILIFGEPYEPSSEESSAEETPAASAADGIAG